VLPGCLRADDFIELESSSRVFYKRRIIEALQQHARASPHRVLPSRFAPRVFLQLCLSESGDGVSPFGAVAHGRRPKKVGCVSSPSRRFVLSDCSASMSASFEIGAPGSLKQTRSSATALNWATCSSSVGECLVNRYVAHRRDGKSSRAHARPLPVTVARSLRR
jgi:hypothetical protein